MRNIIDLSTLQNYELNELSSNINKEIKRRKNEKMFPIYQLNICGDVTQYKKFDDLMMILNESKDLIPEWIVDDYEIIISTIYVSKSDYDAREDIVDYI